MQALTSRLKSTAISNREVFTHCWQHSRVKNKCWKPSPIRGSMMHAIKNRYKINLFCQNNFVKIQGDKQNKWISLSKSNEFIYLIAKIKSRNTELSPFNSLTYHKKSMLVKYLYALWCDSKDIIVITQCRYRFYRKFSCYYGDQKVVCVPCGLWGTDSLPCLFPNF